MIGGSQIVIMRTDRTALIAFRCTELFHPDELKHIIAAVLEDPQAVLQLTRCCFAPQDF